MKRRILCWIATLLIAWSTVPRAATMSDLWWNPSESGWGVNLIEQQGTLFVTLFVYGSDGNPTWYVGPATALVSSSSASRTYSGLLYATRGPWFVGAFNPGSVQVRQVGSVSLFFTSQVAGTITYSVDGNTVTKSIQRQFWKHINLGGTYYGAMDPLSGSTCLTGEPVSTVYTLTATVNPSGQTGALTMVVTLPAGTLTFNGTYAQYGSLYDVTGVASISGVSASARLVDFTADDDGIRGNLITTEGSCVINLRFAAVRPG